MDPAFPDIVGEWARQEASKDSLACCNDNEKGPDGVAERRRSLVARAEVEATRIW